MSAIAVMVISSGGASAQQIDWNPLISGDTASNYDGAIIKVVRRRRGRSRRGRSRGRSRNNAAAALLGGIIIGGAIASHGRNYRGSYYGGSGNAHIDWCYNRYRSYRAYDNTFQPYNGPRRRCNSPYD